MQRQMLDYLVSPCCKSRFSLQVFESTEDIILEGLLSSQCGQTFPVIKGIPRILDNPYQDFPEFLDKYNKILTGNNRQLLLTDNNSWRLLRNRTRNSFGYQWTTFHKMTDQFREGFLNYIYPIPPIFFKNKIGLDAGCGFGRHIYYAAEFGAEIIGVDLSTAVDAAYNNTHQLKTVQLLQGDIYNLPFRGNSFDFIYSIGVLHHLPDPEKGFQALLPLLKKGGSIFIWVFSKKRTKLNLLLEFVRKYTTRFPYGILKSLCFINALSESLLFIHPYRVLAKTPILNKQSEKLMFNRIKLYAQYPFQVCYADWFDRLSAPIRFYYDKEDMEGWCTRAGLKNVVISPTGLYGWRMYAEK